MTTATARWWPGPPQRSRQWNRGHRRRVPRVHDHAGQGHAGIGRGELLRYCRGVLYAAQKGAKVINLSLGGYANSNTLRRRIDTAVNTYGVVVVGGAGNDNPEPGLLPGGVRQRAGGGRHEHGRHQANFSNYGTWVDVSGPAADIRTTALGGDWANGSGTSMAAPLASGLAGLLRTLHPDWNEATIRSQIVHTTDSIDSLNPAFVGHAGEWDA